MAIRHVVTIQVAPGKADEFVAAFDALRAVTMQEEGCEQYELFRSVSDPERMVLLERWASQALLEQHMAAERTHNAEMLSRLVALWAPGSTPVVERFAA